MLQCTAFTELPEMGARVALMGLADGPGQGAEAPGLDDFLLCELGEHDGAAEHAAQLWSASAPAGRDLWMFWTDADGRRKCVGAYQQASAPPVVVYQPDQSGKADVDELIRTIEEGRYGSLPPEDRPEPLMPGVIESP